MASTIYPNYSPIKYNLAMDLAKNSDIEFIKPYTDREIPLDELPEKFGDFHYVSKDTLDMMIEDDEVLSSTLINGDRYVFFKFQLVAPYNARWSVGQLLFIPIGQIYPLNPVKEQFSGTADNATIL